MRKWPERKESLLLLLIFICLMALSGGSISYLGHWLGELAYGIQMDWGQIDWDKEEGVRYFRFLQFFTNIGTFLIPALIFKYWPRSAGYFRWKLDELPIGKWLFWGLGLMLLFLPLVFQLYDWNKSMSLPESFASIEQSMLKAETLRNEGLLAMLSLEGNADWVINILLLCVVAALGEELFFRGIWQDIMCRWFHNKYVAVLVTAFVFSLMHFQFYGFMPRFAMGLLLGLLMLWTQSIWLVVFVHFCFNFSQVVMFTYLNRFLSDHLEQMDGDLVFIAGIIITLIFIGLIWQFKKILDLRNGREESMG